MLTGITGNNGHSGGIRFNEHRGHHGRHTVTTTPQFLAITISPSTYNFTGVNGTGVNRSGWSGCNTE